MLKIVGRAEAPRAHLELDPHLPFLLRVGDAPARGESLIWYCKPDDRSIFEAWLHSKTGALHRISLVVIAPSRISQMESADEGPTIPTSSLVPVGDIAAWNDAEIARNFSQFTERDSFFLVIGRNFVSIRFDQAGEPKEWIVNHRSRFGVDKNSQLCRVDLIGLTPRNVASISEASKPYEPKQE